MASRSTNVNTAWAKLLSDADIKNFRWHDMRHHFASRLIKNNVDLQVVKELLGHGDIKMTLRYAHIGTSISQKQSIHLRKRTPPSRTKQAELRVV